MEINELQHVQLRTLLSFARTSKRFTVLKLSGYLGAVHWAKIDYGLSAGQFLLSCP